MTTSFLTTLFNPALKSVKRSLSHSAGAQEYRTTRGISAKAFKDSREIEIKVNFLRANFQDVCVFVDEGYHEK